MSLIAEQERISRAKGDPYLTLNVSKSASPAQIKAAYKRLALQFHPDRVSVPPHLSTYEADKVIENATSTFKIVSAAFVALSEQPSRPDSSRTSSPAGALVPYDEALTRKPTSYKESRVSDRSFARYNDERATRTNMLNPREIDEPAYRSPAQSAFRHNTFEHHENVVSREGTSQRNPFELFDAMLSQDMSNMFSGFDAAKGAAQYHPSQKPQVSNRAVHQDPFAMFSNMFSGPSRESDNYGSGTARDPFASMFNGLSLDGRDESLPRGTTATQRMTRRHTSRNGDVRLQRQERNLGMFDMGAQGQMIVEQSFSIQVFSPASRAISKSDPFGFDELPSYKPSSNYPGIEQFSNRPVRQRRLSTGYALPSDHMLEGAPSARAIGW